MTNILLVWKHNVVRLTALVALVLLTGLSAGARDASHYAQHSRLAQGKWIKIKVEESGIYQISAQQAQQWGLGDIATLNVYGNGGAIMSDRMEADAPDDLQPVPLVRTGDRILFYAQGPTSWTTNKGGYIIPVQNPYSTAGYYFVGTESSGTTDTGGDDDNNDDSDIASAPARAASLTSSRTTTATGERITGGTATIFHERDMVNPGQTGRIFLGEDFTNNRTQSFSFDLDGLVNGSTVKTLTSFAAQLLYKSESSAAYSHLEAQYNGNNLPAGKVQMMSVTDVSHEHYDIVEQPFDFELSGSSKLDFKLTFVPATLGNLLMARLDFIAVNYKRALTLGNGTGSITFAADLGRTDVQYCITGADPSNIHVLDITSPASPLVVATTADANGVAFSTAGTGTVMCVAFDSSASFPTPERDSEVANQDIHGEPVPDMIILAPSDYLAQARLIAEAHEKYDRMRVLTLDHKKVFNEFSSGTPDAAAYRQLCKYFWDRGTSEDGHRLGYLLLMGNGTFDNRFLTTELKAMAYPALLTWQSEDSSGESISFVSDDIFGILSDNATGNFFNYDLDIAVGRMPVQSVSEARTATTKLIKYISRPDYGAWKNNVLNVADDEDAAQHMVQAESAITLARANGGEDYNYERIYIDAFTQQGNGSTRKYPDANTRMFNYLKDGVVWWNYAGHASPSVWTADGLLTAKDVDENLYYRHLPVLMAATCEFARFDERPRSGMELMVNNAGGGIIAGICPARLVYMGQNKQLQDQVATFTFKRDSEGMPLRLGDIERLAKNASRRSSSVVASNNARYILLGDPALRPAFPSHHAVIDAINGRPVDPDDMPVFQARQTITFTGHIEDPHGERATSFNGSMISTLYDCEQSVTTHGYYTSSSSDGREFTYEERSNRLAINVDKVTNGEFTVSVTIPSEITVSYDNYRPSLINLYAYDETDTIEANGSNNDFYIYGYDDTVKEDKEGPEIEDFFLNSSDFKNGDNVNESPLVMADISDESGINFSSAGIGHSITLTLDDNITYSDVSSFYIPVAPESGKGNAGAIQYPLSDLADGYHTLKLKVWDVYNNSSEKTIEFYVVRGLKPEVLNITCSPNPASVETNFVITHDRPNATVTITVEVFNLLGRRVWSTTQTGQSDLFTSFPITWDLNADGGGRVPRGIYIYRASISTDGEQKTTKSKKIAITGE